MSARQYDTHFTLQEAREILPWVREIVDRIRELFEIFKNRGFDIVSKRWSPSGNGHSNGPPPEEYEEFINLIAELDQRGVFIKNFRRGIVDFPHIRKNGEEVYLCWTVGEKTISFWHRISQDFSDRAPITDE